MEEFSGVSMRIGTRNVEKGITTLSHNNDFMIDEISRCKTKNGYYIYNLFRRK